MATVLPKPLTSAAGYLALLEENDTTLQILALERLNAIESRHWPEITGYLTEIEKLYENEAFPKRELASLVICKIYYHLEEYSEALQYALGAGDLFSASESSEFLQTIVAKCIDEYIKQRDQLYNEKLRKDLEKSKLYTTSDDVEMKTEIVIDRRLEAIVEKMLNICMKKGEEKQALGVALDSRRLDKVQEILVESKDQSKLLHYCLYEAQNLVSVKRFRYEIYELLATLFQTVPEDQIIKNYPNLCMCHFFLNRHKQVADIFSRLLQTSEGALMAYQIAFDLVDMENRSFLQSILNDESLALPKDLQSATLATTATPATSATPAAPVENTVMHKDTSSPLQTLRYILNGNASIHLKLEFLHRNNRADLLLLDQYKNSISDKSSVLCHGIIICHSLMLSGTTCDSFLRHNLTWMAKAMNWAKFSSTASLGVLHKGHINESKSVLAHYLPNDNPERSSHVAGGALYALGLIHANHNDSEIKEYLLKQTDRGRHNEVLQHGGCLGIGLVCMGLCDESIFEILKGIMFTDSAIAGEAAAYGIGLVMLGSASEKAISELLAYAHDTQHEKIIRACAVAMAFVMYRREEEADSLIEKLSQDKDPFIRFGAMYTIAMAYCGTGHNASIKNLLHISVSDVSNDVRRAAVIAIGFVLCNLPEQVPRVLSLLSESFNPHVRYAAAIAIGICSAGSASNEALNVILPMTSDSTDFVRQGAFVSLGLLLQQVNLTACDKVTKVRELIQKVIGDKHEDLMSRFGAILGAGLLDAGGRNCRISFFSRTGHLRQEAVVGLCLFTQFWYWHPLIYSISLAFDPTALIGLTDKLEIPPFWNVKCISKSDSFDYYPPVSQKKKDDKKETMTAILSTTMKRRAMKDQDTASKASKSGEGEQADLSNQMDVDKEETTVKDSQDSSQLDSSSKEKETDVPLSNTELLEKNQNKDVEMQSAKDDLVQNISSSPTPSILNQDELASPVSEMVETLLQNPCRVLPQQQSSIVFLQDSRYVPINPERKSGFLILQDTRPDEVEKVETKDVTKSEAVNEKPKEITVNTEETVEPPAEFEWKG